jgi:hypothetical protein
MVHFWGQVLCVKIAGGGIWANALNYHVVEVCSCGCVDRAGEFLNREVSKGRATNELPILIKDFRRHGKSNVGGRTKVSTKDQLVIWECRDGVAEHHSIIPAKFAYLTDVSCAPFHNSFGDLTAGGIYVVGGV